MQVCPHCGRESRDIDRYCLHCGQRMDPANGAEAMPSYSAIPPARGAAPGSGGDLRGALGKRAVVSGAKPPPAVKPRVANAHLVLKAREGELDDPREYPLDGRDIVIGRAPSCDVVLPSDQLASRRHTQLEFDGVTYTIRDLGSSNGTYVNGEEIHQTVVLNDGDTIGVGEHELVYALAPLRNTDGFPVPVPPPWPPAPNGAGQPAGPTEKHSAVSNARHEMPPGAFGAAAAPTGRPAGARAATGAPRAGGEAGDLEQLHQLLLNASEGMVRRAEAAERQVEELRAAFAEIERQLADALTALAGDASGGGAAQLDAATARMAERRLDELVRLAQAAAENPRLDHVSALAARAGEVSDALEAARQLARALGAMGTRLAELSAEPMDGAE